jgi:ribonuclease Y
MYGFPYLLAEAGTQWPWVFVAAALGAAVAWSAAALRARFLAATHRATIDRELTDARQRRDEIVKAAEVAAEKTLLDMRARFEASTTETREELKAAEKRLAKREDALDRKMDVLNTKERKIESGEQELARQQEELARRQGDVERTLTEQRSELLRISRLTPETARAECLQRIERELEREAGQMVERILTQAQTNAREKARQITVDAIQRYAAEHTCEATVATVDVPTDDMKGRIIGREGRNIRAFEKATGVTLVVDDTPGIVSITCFNPVRKEVARLALEHLIKDGRIHPTRIEELVHVAQQEIDERCAESGRQAALEVDVNGLAKRVIDTLGRLQFRTSYGQNVLRHSVEVAVICGIMADELGLDAALARRCGLLHDIGKALDHDEAEGAHTKIGAEFCKKFNEHAAVINAVAGHHGDVAATSPYTPLVMAADAASASRPGSRRESLEKYIKRLEELEGIATEFPGVRQAHAVEAGREVRVIVDAVQIDDRSSLKLARDIAQKIEQKLTYPGEIKVTVLREIRAVEYAR